MDGALNVVDVVDGLFFLLEGTTGAVDADVETGNALDMNAFPGELGGESSLDGGGKTPRIGSSRVVGCKGFVGSAVLDSSVSASGSLGSC